MSFNTVNHLGKSFTWLITMHSGIALSTKNAFDVFYNLPKIQFLKGSKISPHLNNLCT